MELYFIFTAIGLGLFLIGTVALIWMVRSGQVDDLETPAYRMLTDDLPVAADDLSYARSEVTRV